MTVYKFKRFARFARKAGISDAMLWRAANEIEAGRIDADLGGGVIKQRVARPGGGKSGGFRTIVLFCVGSDVFFVHGLPRRPSITYRLRIWSRSASLQQKYCPLRATIPIGLW